MESSASRFGAGLRSSVRDVLLIVISILIAFFLDAWWDDQLEQKEISDNLRAISVDFHSTKEELTNVLDANIAYIDKVTTLITLELNELARLDASAKAELTWLLPRGGLTFDPVLGSVNALISSGQLNRVRNRKLRGLIGAWPALMDEIGEDQEILIDTYMAIQERNVDLGIYLLGLRGESMNNSSQNDYEILKTVIEDAEMLNRLAAHRFAVDALNEELSQVDSHLDRILLAIEQQLGRESANLTNN